MDWYEAVDSDRILPIKAIWYYCLSKARKNIESTAMALPPRLQPVPLIFRAFLHGKGVL